MAQNTTAIYGGDPKFNEYYQSILASMKPNTVEYNAPTPEEIASQISAYLRPAVDQQIRARREATAQQRAATDADAASRGILASTWVTDIKNRLHQNETADIAAAESDYRSQLLQGVFNRQAQEADRANQIAMFNAQMRQQAEADAYKRAGDQYNIYLQNRKSGSGGGKGGGAATEPAAPSDPSTDAGYANFLKLQASRNNNLQARLNSGAVLPRPDLIMNGRLGAGGPRFGFR